MYIGITASTGGATSIQTMSDFTINGNLVNSFNENFLKDGRRLPPNPSTGKASIPCDCQCRSGYGENPFRLTENLGYQASAIWAADTSSVNPASFSASFQYFIEGSSQADGFTLCFSRFVFIAGDGGGLGYQGSGASSVAIEVDSFQNDHDPSNSHVAIIAGGSVITHLQLAEVTIRPSGIISANYSGGRLKVNHNQVPILDYAINIPSIAG
jgi:hypothetical protein